MKTRHPALSPLATALTLAALLWTASPAVAQTAAAPANAAASAPPQVEAEVRKIDARAGKITLKHGDIPNLDMPPMTMVFQVKEGTLPAALKAGDKVRFRADKVDGAYTVLELVIAP
jgi:Cu(I)/Ag(I) efflux system periplasmic protein CusF